MFSSRTNEDRQCLQRIQVMVVALLALFLWLYLAAACAFLAISQALTWLCA